MTTSSVSSRQNSAAVENDEDRSGAPSGLPDRWPLVDCVYHRLLYDDGVAYALLATPVFKANALLQVEKRPAAPLFSVTWPMCWVANRLMPPPR